MVAVSTQSGKPRATPDLSEYRRRYPLTVASFGALADREGWLDRIWEQDARWRRAADEGGRAREAVVRSAPPAGLMVEGEFEIIYAGGVTGLMHAAVMASRYDRRVMVFDTGAIGRAYRDWNISDEELSGFERAGLFTKEEIEAAVANRYQSAFVKFHDARSRVKTPPLWVEGVMNVAVEADKLLGLAAARLEASGTGSALLSGFRFVRCYLRPERVLVEVEDVRTGRRRLFGARLFVDAAGAFSPVARQLNGAQPFTHVCPTVGTVSRGLLRGTEPGKADFGVGEILVSNEDARDHRQLIWGGLAGSPSRDEYTTYLFFYDAVDSRADKSLLSLFERYFEQLPGYKRAGAQWRVLRPVFGHAPAFHTQTLRPHRRPGAEDRVLLMGEGAAASGPVRFGGAGASLRDLHRLTHLTDLALAADLLDASSLSEIVAGESRVARVSGLAEFLRPAPKSAPSSVNETLNAVMAALHSLDERVRRELFQDRMTFSALKRLLGRTAKLYPRIFQRVREHLGARGTFWWLAQIATAAFSERRAGKELAKEGQGQEDVGSAREFARQVAIYKSRES